MPDPTDIAVGDRFQIAGHLDVEDPAVATRIEAWERDAAGDVLVAAVDARGDGSYVIEFGQGVERRPDVFLRAVRGERVIATSEDDIRWDLRPGRTRIDLAASVVPTISGRVVDELHQPVSGAVVRVDRVAGGAGGAVELGRARTDAGGRYAVEYDDTDPVDIEVRVGGRARATRYAVTGATVVDVTLGDVGWTGPTALERLLADVAAVRGEADPQALVGLGGRDIERVVAHTAADASVLEVAASAGRVAGELGIPAEVAYALVGRGLPADAEALLATPTSAMRAAVATAIESNLVPRSIAAVADDALETLRSMRVARLLDDQPDDAVGTLRDALDAGGVRSRAKLERVAAALADDEQLEGADRLAVDLAEVTGNNADLIRVVRRRRVSDVRELAALDADGWKELVASSGAPVPPSIRGRTGSARVEAYAASLAERLETAFPSEAMLARAGADAAFPQHRELSAFVKDHPDFRLDGPPVTTFLSEQGVDAPADAVTAVQSLQRVFAIAPRYQAASALMADGLDSALAITQVGEEAFVARHRAVLGGPESAHAAYRTAEVRAMTAVAVLITWMPPVLGTLEPMPAPPVPVPDWEELFGSADLCECKHCESVVGPAAYLTDVLHFLSKRAAAGNRTAKDVLLSRRPDLGELELTCDNTNITLPYVDLVNEVLEEAIAPKRFALDPGLHVSLDSGVLGDDVKGAFAAAGIDLPDDAELHVFQEGMRWAIRHPGWRYSIGTSLHDLPVVVTPQTTGTAREQEASPEHVHALAYDSLRARSHPWVLPFDLWLDEVRAFLGHLGVERAELMDDVGVAPQAAVAAERLGLAGGERAAVTGAAGSARDAWAGSGAGQAWVAPLRTVRTLLDRSGLRYEELADLLTLRWVNPGRVLRIESTDANDPHTCDTTKLAIPALTADHLDRIHRFVRVRQHLGWRAVDLDRALALLPGGIDDDGLVVLAELERARTRLQLDVPTLLSLFAPTDTYRYVDAHGVEQPSAHDEVFRNRAVELLAPGAAGRFAVNDAGDELLFPSQLTPAPADNDDIKRDIEALRSAVAGAVGITGAETAELIEGVDAVLGAAAALDLGALASIRRHGVLARALGMSVEELLALKRLVGLDPFVAAAAAIAPVDLARLRVFTEALETIQAAGHTIAELDYLLQHRIDPRQPLGPSPQVVAQYLTALREALRAIRDDTRPVPDPLGEVVMRKCVSAGWTEAEARAIKDALQAATVYRAPLAALPAGVVLPASQPIRFAAGELEFMGPMTTAQRTALRQLSNNQAFRGAVTALFEAPRDAVAAKLSQFPSGEPALSTADVNGLFGAARPPQERFEFVLARVDAHLRRTGGAQAVQQLLAGTLDLTVAVVSSLLTSWAYDPADPDARLLTRFVDPAFVDAEVVLSRDTAPEAFDALGLLAKVADVVRRWNLPPRQLDLLLAHASELGWLDLRELPLDAGAPAPTLLGWLRMAKVLTWQAELPETEPSVVELLVRAYAFDPAAADAAQVKAGILRDWSRATGWRLADLEVLLGAGDEVADAGLLGVALPAAAGDWNGWADEETWLRVRRCLATAARTGATITACYSWAQEAVTIEDAHNARQAARAKQSPDTWLDVVGPISDTLRERRRQALVAELVARPPKNSGVEDANDLFAWYLIDVEMQPCMTTSRLKQAISSVQLFAQRCLLNLEPDVPMGNDPSWAQWRWMRTYRVWEAARKIFLWPENWTEPELRDDKSALFVELEESLAQSDLDDESAEDALHAYLDQLAQIAQLDVVGVLEDTASAPAPASREVHVVAKTRATPPVYYYRKRVDTRWTPWERVDADLEGDYVLPVVWNGRVHLLWPVFTEFQPTTPFKMPGAGEVMANPPKRVHMQLAWTDRRRAGWSAKRMTKYKLYPTDVQPALKGRLALAPYAETNGDLVVRVYNHFQANQRSLAPTYFRLSAATGAGVVMEPGGRAIDGYWSSFGWYQATSFGSPPGVYVDNMALHQNGATFDAKDGSANPVTLFGKRPGPSPFEVRAHHFPSATFTRPLVYADGLRSFYVEHRTVIERNKAVGRVAAAPFHHPRVREFSRVLRRFGLDAMYDRSVQIVVPRDLRPDYAPTNVVLEPFPVDDVDFSYDGAYAGYNWELFFHVPLLIATRLTANQRFEEAQRWLHRIFDPTDRSAEPSPQRFWKTRPFFEVTAAQRASEQHPGTLPAAVLTDQVRVWRNDPFNPHAVARMRRTSYQRTTVMKYLDNLIGWADQLFRRDTIESINEATQLYVLAAEILGRRPDTVTPRARPVPQTFGTIAPKLDAFSNALVAAESLVPPIEPDAAADPAAPPAPPITLPAMRYFCIPRNEKLLGYWDTVADRLFKIRHCMNIEGIERQLALFEPPIDPAALVRAAAAGVDIGAVLADSAAPLPPYRFTALAQKATELCNEVQSLGAALLATLEKRDAEMLALLRSDQELAMYDAVRRVREEQVEEAKRNLDALDASRDLTALRREYYASQEFMNLGETLHIAMSGAASTLQGIAGGMDAVAGVLALIPNFKVGAPTSIGVTYGGENVSASLRAFSGMLNTMAGLLHAGASTSLTLAGYQRRSEEWHHQVRMADQELEQLARQRAASEVRLAIAEREVANQELQIEHANKTKDVMETKFTNRQLYDWMVGQVSGLYFRSFQLAFDMAKRAERAYRYELGLQDSNFIRFGSWDSLRKGLLAGDRLVHELKRMEASWLDEHRRHFELTKTVSLATLDPVALVRLRETGSCFVTMPEGMFDLDHPGHYMRRLKSVALTIPSVAGPYTNVNATLTLLASRVRTSASSAGGYAWTGVDDPRFVEMTTAVQSIATSHGQRDAGLFAVDFNDQRYLPFEGQGAVSEWRIELDPDTNRFDLRTVTDVLLHVSYTARDGGGALRAKAKAQLPKTDIELIELRRELASEWARFMRAPDTATYDELVIDLARLAPFRPGGGRSRVSRIEVYARVVPKAAGGGAPPPVPDLPLELRVGAGAAAANAADVLANTPLRDVPALGVSAASVVLPSARVPGQWTLRIAGAAVPAPLRRSVVVDGVTKYHLDEAAVPDVYLAIHYIPA